MIASDLPETVMIPQGEFLMGCETGQDNERPLHAVWIDSFGLGKFSIINFQYGKFLESTGMTPPPLWAINRWWTRCSLAFRRTSTTSTSASSGSLDWAIRSCAVLLRPIRLPGEGTGVEGEAEL